jgi:hypothetical protein
MKSIICILLLLLSSKAYSEEWTIASQDYNPISKSFVVILNSDEGRTQNNIWTKTPEAIELERFNIRGQMEVGPTTREVSFIGPLVFKEYEAYISMGFKYLVTVCPGEGTLTVVMYDFTESVTATYVWRNG